MQITATELRFLQGLLTDRSDRTPSHSAELFQQERNIGRRVGRKFVYSEQDVERARSLLLALNLPLCADVEPSDRAGAASRPGITEKAGTVAPHGNSVAFRQFSGRESVAGPGYQVATANEVASLAPDLLIVVENFETFRQLDRYDWVMSRLASRQRTLAIFRGDKIYKYDDARRSIDALECPAWGFHDFDPAGLHMSLGLKNLSEHLAPPIAALQAAVVAMKRSDLYFSQVTQFGQALGACGHAQVSELWAIMRTLQKGLPQEWMRDI